MPIFIRSSFFLFLLLIPATFSLSFNLSSIRPSDAGSINITGDAYISNQGIQVTPDERNIALGKKAGRATYNKPLHLWDKASGQLTDFSTHFSFVLDSNGGNYYGDGLAFFLAPVNSSIHPWMYGGGLGLGSFNTSAVDSSSEYSFVAVEFDTFSNDHLDPDTDHPYVPHVGIDINSVSSVTTKVWNISITEGVQNDAWISFNSSSKMLSVDFTSHSFNRNQKGSLRYVVDLRDYLPEYVAFGFSAATGDLFEKNNVKSWDFYSSEISSSLQANVSSEAPTPGPEPAPANSLVSGNNSEGDSKMPTPTEEPAFVIGGGKKSKGNKGLIVGLSVGLSILILASAFAGYGLWKKKYKKEPKDREFFDSFINNEFEKGTGPKKFPYRELVLATNNFAEDQKLGEGGFGGVYRGFLRETNSVVAVKRVSKGSKQGPKEYASEVMIISQLRHRNLVQLLGWCY